MFLCIRLITSDPHIEEIDFEHHYIGDAAGREILHAMQQRRDGNTHCMYTQYCSANVFMPTYMDSSFVLASYIVHKLS